jgi:hypothetical protein
VTGPEIGPETDLSPGEAMLLDRLTAGLRESEQITLVLGSGVSAGAVPRIPGVLAIADKYAAGRNDEGALDRALAQARSELVGPPAPIELYVAYRQVFTDWVARGAFDVIAQQAVLKAYTVPDPMESPLATRGLGQRLERGVGEALENDRFSWLLPRGVQALGHLLTQTGEAFDHRVLTTNFDPLVEIAVRSATGLAVSLPLDAGGGHGPALGIEGTIRVFHLHGFWRPTLHVHGRRLLPDPAALTAPGSPLDDGVPGLIRGATVLVLGTGDWAGTVTRALAAVAAYRPVRVLWAVHQADPDHALDLADRVRRATGAEVEAFPGVDSDRLFPALADAIGVAVPPRETGLRHRVRHHSWERALVSQLDTRPPADVPGLLLQLERRFGWISQPHGTVEPARVLWPVRQRARGSVIHMVQAFVAGALARLGVEVKLVIDDLAARDAGTGDVFRTDLRRWVAHTGHGAGVEFVSLQEFVDSDAVAAVTPEATLLRPVDPWGVARRVLYSEQNPSLYSVLAAAKAVPHVTDWDALEAGAGPIVQSILRTDASRLMTPLLLWSYLNYLLLTRPTADVITLSGRDEALMWAQWRQSFGYGTGHLYNPYVKNLRHDSHMLSWSSEPELTQHLQRTGGLRGWDAEGSYIPWLFQNALLLPGYLNHEAVPETADFPLDSWAAFAAAVEDGKPVLELLSRRVSALYLSGDAER